MIYYTVMLVFDIIVGISRWRRRRKVDRRIIAQAKAAGVWDTRPLILGGRALDLKVWEDFKIKRIPGESDSSLRYRYLTKADGQLTITKKDRHDELDAFVYGIGAQICDELNLPDEIRYEVIKSTKKNKGGHTNE